MQGKEVPSLAWNIRTTRGNKLKVAGVEGMHTRVEREWGGEGMQRQGASPMRTSGPSKLECRTCCNPRLPNVTLASLAPQARMTSRTCESAASCFAQPPLASPRRIFSTPVFFPCAWSRRHLGLRAARALRHRESQRVERGGFGLRHGRLRAHHSAYTPLPEAWHCAVVFNCKEF